MAAASHGVDERGARGVLWIGIPQQVPCPEVTVKTRNLMPLRTYECRLRSVKDTAAQSVSQTPKDSRLVSIIRTLVAERSHIVHHAVLCVEFTPGSRGILLVHGRCQRMVESIRP